MKAPEFDFSSYDPNSIWYFPAQRMLHFAYEGYQIFSESRKKVIFFHRYPDLRFVVLHELSGFCSALGNTAMLMRAHEQQPDWWKQQPEIDFEVDAQLADVKLQQVRHQATLGFVQSIVRQVDQAIRQYDKVLGLRQTDEGHKPLSAVLRRVLRGCDLPAFEPLLKLWLVVRDCLSTQEKFRPLNGKSLQIRYPGRNFKFDPKSDIDYQAIGFLDFWDLCLYLIAELDEMLMALTLSKPMMAIPVVKVPYLD